MSVNRDSSVSSSAGSGMEHFTDAESSLHNSESIVDLDTTITNDHIIDDQESEIAGFTPSREDSVANDMAHLERTRSEGYEAELQDEVQRVISHHSSLFSKKSNSTIKANTTEADQQHYIARDDSTEKEIPSASSTGDEEQEEDVDEIDPKAMDWDSPDDPGNPVNWPSWKKWYATMTVAFICLVVTIGSSMFVAGVPQIRAEWGISETLGLAGLTFYILGLAFGPVIAAPLSEIFGRKIVYCITLPTSMLFIMGVGLSQNIGQVLVLRFFAGFTAAAALAVGGGSITDVWRPHEIGLAMTCFCLAPLAGPVVGPIIGGFVAEKKGWRWTLWVNLMFGGAILPFVLLMPETYKPIIMMKRIKQRNLKQKKGLPLGQFLVAVVFITLLKPMQMLVLEPIVLVFSIYAAFIFAVLFGFFEAYPVIFEGTYHMNQGIQGLTFIGVGVGLIFGAITYVLVDKYVYFKKHSDGYIGLRDKQGNNLPPTPESRLLTCKIGSVTLGPSLFWLGWTARSSVHWMAPLAAGVPFGFALILIFFSILTYFSMSYPPLSVASALAANNLLRYLLACIFPLFTVQMYERLGNGWASSLLGFIGFALLPVPWIFTKYGPTLRSRSRFGFAAQQKAVAAQAEV